MLAEFTFNFTDPTFWVTAGSIGTALGFVIAFFATREFRKQTEAARLEQVRVLTETIKQKDELAKSISEAQTAQISEINRSHSERVAIVTAEFKAQINKVAEERDLLRDQKHTVANLLNAANLKIQEYELMPDLTKLEQFYSNLLSAQERQLSAMQRMEKEHISHGDICERAAKVLNILVDKLIEHKIIPQVELEEASTQDLEHEN